MRARIVYILKGEDSKIITFNILKHHRNSLEVYAFEQ